MSPRRRSPRPLGLALDLARGDWEPATLLAEVQRIWSEVVGPVIAAEASPQRERGGVLTVLCSASVWAQELELMGPAIVARLNTRLDGEPLGRILGELMLALGHRRLSRFAGISSLIGDRFPGALVLLLTTSTSDAPARFGARTQGVSMSSEDR